MDFDLGNILYVVITLVAIIAGLLGKKKKPADQAPEETEKEAQPGFFENLERMLRMGQENPEVTELQDYEEDILIDELASDGPQSSAVNAETVLPSKSILDDYDQIMNSMDGVVYDSSFTDGDYVDGPMEVLDIDNEQETNYFDIVRDFDAGTAVVYAAIINRLDY